MGLKGALRRHSKCIKHSRKFTRLRYTTIFINVYSRRSLIIIGPITLLYLPLIAVILAGCISRDDDTSTVILRLSAALLWER